MPYTFDKAYLIEAAIWTAVYEIAAIALFLIVTR